MSFLQPTTLEIFAHAVVYDRLGNKLFRSYVDNLPLNGNETLLDLGAGSGVVSKHLARRLLAGGGTLICLDISEPWLRIARKKMQDYSNVDYKFGDIFQVKLENQSLDAVFIHFMLHDIKKDQQLQTLIALNQKLKTGGKIYIKEPTKTGHGMQVQEIRSLMQQAGFKETSLTLTKSPRASFEAVFYK